MVADEKTVVECGSPKLAGLRVTRAHVLVDGARRLGQSFQQALSRVAQTLSQELGKPVSIRGRLLPSASRGRDALADPAAFAQFDLGSIGAAALLELETPIAGAFVDALAGGAATASAPYSMTSAERAAIGYLSLVVVRCIRDDANLDNLFAPRFVRIAESTAEASSVATGLGSYLVVELKLKIAECEGLGRLLVPSRPIAGVFAAQPAESGRPVRLRAEIPAAVFAPNVVLEATDLAGLSTGDVVMVPGAKLVAGCYHGSGAVRSDAFCLEGGFGPKGFVVQSVRTSTKWEEVMTPNNAQGPSTPGRPTPNAAGPSNALKPPTVPAGVPGPRPAPAAAAAAKSPAVSVGPAVTPTFPATAKPLAPLPIEIEVELARIKVPLADLANVEPGAILPLHIAPTAGVVLRIGEKRIARAELVDIDGELGARITEVDP